MTEVAGDETSQEMSEKRSEDEVTATSAADEDNDASLGSADQTDNVEPTVNGQDEGRFLLAAHQHSAPYLLSSVHSFSSLYSAFLFT